MTSQQKLSGLFAPIATPFDVNESPDFDALRFNMRKYRESGIHGVLALGSNGENKSLAESERREVLEVMMQEKGDLVVMAGVFHESHREAMESIQQAGELGADLVLLQSPSYFKKQLTDVVLHTYFTDLADLPDLPLLIYQSPGFNGMHLSMNLLERLAGHPNIVGMKDSSPGCDTEVMRLNSDAFHVLPGAISKMKSFVESGAIGATASLANYCPELANSLYQSLRKGDPAEALNEQLVALNVVVAGQYGVPGVKAAMDVMGFRGWIPRRPLMPVSGDDLQVIRDALEKIQN